LLQWKYQEGQLDFGINNAIDFSDGIGDLLFQARLIPDALLFVPSSSTLA